MNSIRTAACFAVSFLAACSDRTPTAPDASTGARFAASAAAKPRPFDGHCATTVGFVAPLPGDAPNVLRLHITYLCQLTHMGRTTGIAEQVVTFTGPSTAIASNSTTLTAANGDQLFGTWTGTSSSVGPDISFSGPSTFVGGTGRFAAASGSSFTEGTASFVTNTGQFTMKGTLSY